MAVTYPAQTFEQATELAIISSNQLHDIITGTAVEQVQVEDGSYIPTVRKSLVDNFYFKSPLEWSLGVNEAVFNQLRSFDEGGGAKSWWYAPSATATTPILMGASPHEDTNWRLYPLHQSSTSTPVGYDTLTDVMNEQSSVLTNYAEAGTNIFTFIHNTISGAGGHSYRVSTLTAERTRRGNLTWTPEGVLSGDRYIGVDYYLPIGDGLTYVLVADNNGEISDKAAGVIGHIRNGVYDDGPAINKLITYCRNGAAIGLGLSGSTIPKFTPRSIWYISETLDLLDFNVSINWGNSELRPSSPITAIAYEQSGTDFSSLQIWYDHLDPQEVYDAQQAAFVFSKDRPVATTSESAFGKISRVWIYNAYQGFRLYSQSPSGGLFWQFAWENCLTWNTFDRGWFLWSVSQVSTTTTLRNCHSKNVTRDIVKHNSKNYAALQTMLPATIIEPGVTVGWRDYWIELSTYSDTRPAWTSGTFYRTCGKGYLVNNVQTVSFDNCSADGGVNFEAGNIMSVNNSNITVNSFHLEGTNLNFPDSPPIICDTDVQWGCLYMYDLRIQMPNTSDRCALIGGSVGKERNLSFDSLRNHTQNSFKIGDFDIIRPFRTGASTKDFVRVKTGVGVSQELVTTPELLTVFSTDRVNTRTADLQYVMQAAGNYYKIYETLVPDVGAATPTYLEFSDLIEVSANCGNTAIASQQVGKYAKVRISVFVESGVSPNRSIYDIAVVAGDSSFIYKTFDPITRKLSVWSKCTNNAQSTIASFTGKNGGFDTLNGTSRMLYAVVKGVGATVESMVGFSEVQGVSMSGLPQLAPDLTFVESRAGTFSPAKTLSLTASSSTYSTLLSISTTSSKGMVSLLSLVSPTALSYYIRLTVDGVVVWNSTAVAFAASTVTPLIGAFSKSSQNTLTESGYGFNSSFLLEVKAASGAPTIVCDYLVRPVK